MLAFLRGTVLHTFDTSLILDVHDVGYRVFAIEGLLHRVRAGEPLSLYVHDHRKEDASDLYGFATADELAVFERLISVSGVGPKTALNALNAASAEGIRHAIARGDAGLLRSVSGIGSKTAERIVIELKGVFVRENGAGHSSDEAEIVDALVNLGYSARDAAETVRTLAGGESTEEKLKLALKGLGSTR